MTAIQRLMVDGQLEPVSHYCHVVRAGNLVWVSGTVGVRTDGSIPPGVVEQFDVALASLDTCLRAAGASAETVVKVNVYLTNVADRALINPARQRYFGEHRPASTLVEVSALVLPALKVEIEAQAVIP
jgi:2-iminobutanoate/2-iminopropanoate deaminase